MYCINCGKEIPQKTKFCAYCGAEIASLSNEENESSSFSEEQPMPLEGIGAKSNNKNILLVLIIIAIAVVAIVLLILNKEALPKGGIGIDGVSIENEDANSKEDPGDGTDIESQDQNDLDRIGFVLEAQTDLTGSDLQEVMKRTKAIIESRLKERGLSASSTLVLEGDKRIRIELPRLENTSEIIQAIWPTGKLQFLLADGTVALEGTDVESASIKSDPDHGGYLITLEFTSEGWQKFYEATNKAYNREVQGPFIDGISAANQIAIVLDGIILSAPGVDNGPISGGSAVITRSGGFDEEYANTVSILIDSGALPVELLEVESYEVNENPTISND